MKKEIQLKIDVTFFDTEIEERTNDELSEIGLKVEKR